MQSTAEPAEPHEVQRALTTSWIWVHQRRSRSHHQLCLRLHLLCHHHLLCLRLHHGLLHLLRRHDHLLWLRLLLLHHGRVVGPHEVQRALTTWTSWIWVHQRRSRSHHQLCLRLHLLWHHHLLCLRLHHGLLHLLWHHDHLLWLRLLLQQHLLWHHDHLSWLRLQLLHLLLHLLLHDGLQHLLCLLLCLRNI